MIQKIELILPKDGEEENKRLQFSLDEAEGIHYNTEDGICIKIIEKNLPQGVLFRAELEACPPEYEPMKEHLMDLFSRSYENELSLQIESEESGVEDYGTASVSQEEPGEMTEEDYPDLSIKIDRDQYSIFEMKRKYDRGQICMDPDFQRNFVWQGRQMSELIESVIMGIPLPLIYLAENRDGRLVVVDGRQRLTTFIDFLNNKFRLSNLKILTKLSGMNFKDLEKSKEYSQYTTAIEDFQLVIQVIKYPTPDKVRFDIFDRVNRGGTPLNKQEMRNALYQGQSTILLKELAESAEFKKATGSAVSSKHMKDRYLILRALCFSLYERGQFTDGRGKPYEYKSDLEDFLGKGMERLNNASEQDLAALRREFKQTMMRVYRALGPDAFRIPGRTDRRRPISMTLFETFYYLVLLEDDAEDQSLQVYARELLDDGEFLHSLQFSVDSKVQVDKRFGKVREKCEGKQ